MSSVRAGLDRDHRDPGFGGIVNRLRRRWPADRRICGCFGLTALARIEARAAAAGKARCPAGPLTRASSASVPPTSSAASGRSPETTMAWPRSMRPISRAAASASAGRRQRRGIEFRPGERPLGREQLGRHVMRPDQLDPGHPAVEQDHAGEADIAERACHPPGEAECPGQALACRCRICARAPARIACVGLERLDRIDHRGRIAQRGMDDTIGLQIVTADEVDDLDGVKALARPPLRCRGPARRTRR